MNDRLLIDLLQPGVNMHIPGARLSVDTGTRDVVLERGGERHVLLTRAEVDDGSYREKFLGRVLARREDK